MRIWGPRPPWQSQGGRRYAAGLTGLFGPAGRRCLPLVWPFGPPAPQRWAAQLSFFLWAIFFGR
ncbi:hypothetical protein SGRA_4065 [Saprospira grandis str. Lewin]|uniref:Uncharacterized protein n=1 Tax=Saprospira grandis (strain Lewin) TaxID=984262 RepID=H6L7A8_SAPGL|nr:hypothetical protein SGRA_4065 [Saprospira grandis str. Lewin]